MKPGDVISYLDMCQREGVNLQRGMNFKLGKHYSVILMSVRVGAPYEDEFTNDNRTIIYEGHDVPKTESNANPKKIDQRSELPSGRLTQNGLFHDAAQRYRQSHDKPELVRVYEKIKSGIWVFNGLFELTDSWIDTKCGRKVFKFKLDLASRDSISRDIPELKHNRLIPSKVKVEVWRRDRGRCVKCGATDNLHFDHILPYSKGGTSITPQNVQLLCARHNLSKGAKIED